MKTLLKTLGLTSVTLLAISSGVMVSQTKKTIRRNY